MSKNILVGSHILVFVLGFCTVPVIQHIREQPKDPFKERCWEHIHTCLVNQEFYKGTDLEQEFSLVGQQFVAALEQRSSERFDEAWVNLCNIQEPEIELKDVQRMRDAERTVDSKLK